MNAKRFDANVVQSFDVKGTFCERPAYDRLTTPMEVRVVTCSRCLKDKLTLREGYVSPGHMNDVLSHALACSLPSPSTIISTSGKLGRQGSAGKEFSPRSLAMPSLFGTFR